MAKTATTDPRPDGCIRIEPVFEPPHVNGMFLGVWVPHIPQGSFRFMIPEWIGDGARQIANCGQITSQWVSMPSGDKRLQWSLPGTCELTVTLCPGAETIDFTMAIRNTSEEAWAHVHAFNCLHPQDVEAFSDPEMARTFMVTRDGGLRRLCDTERREGPRPLQFYPIEGRPFPEWVTSLFDATSPQSASEPFMATVSADGGMTVATGAERASFLFNNGEASCTHVNPDFGDIPCGAGRQVKGRVYFIRGGVEQAYQRYRDDFGRG